MECPGNFGCGFATLVDPTHPIKNYRIVVAMGDVTR